MVDFMYCNAADTDGVRLHFYSRGRFVGALLLAQLMLVSCTSHIAPVSQTAAEDCKVSSEPDQHPGAASVYEGFGSITTGGQAGETVYVTSLANSGQGTLRDALVNRSFDRSGNLIPRIVDFSALAAGGNIPLQSAIIVTAGSLTIDGSTAPSPGITIRKVEGYHGSALWFERQSRQSRVSDIILTHLRIVGNNCQCGGDNITLEGVERVVIDHVSSAYSDDGAIDIVGGGGNRDITISWSLLYQNDKAMLIKYGDHENLSLHHNVFARNTERNPQSVNQNATTDYVNNVVYHWGEYDTWGYGVRIMDCGNSAIGAKMNLNGNVFIAGSVSPENAVILSRCESAALFFQDNILPIESAPLISTVSSVLPIPAEAQVTTFPANSLDRNVLPSVGMRYRNPEENQLILDIQNTF